MFNIPEELINFIENVDASFIDCILNEPANFVELTEKMNFYTIECFCGYAPTFDKMWDEFDFEVIWNLHEFHPEIDTCVVKTTTTPPLPL